MPNEIKLSKYPSQSAVQVSMEQGHFIYGLSAADASTIFEGLKAAMSIANAGSPEGRAVYRALQIFLCGPESQS